MRVFDSMIDPSKSRTLTLDKKERYKHFGFTFDLGVRRVHVVALVMEGGAAERAGLCQWDKIVEL